MFLQARELACSRLRVPPLPVTLVSQQSTPIREAVERMVAVGSMSRDDVDVLSSRGRALSSNGAQRHLSPPIISFRHLPRNLPPPSSRDMYDDATWCCASWRAGGGWQRQTRVTMGRQATTPSLP